MNSSLWGDRSNLETTPPDVVAAIKGAKVLIERFGRWPTFEDAEVVSLEFNRGTLLRAFKTGDYSEAVHPSVTAVLYVFNAAYASDLDRKDSLVTLRFEGLGLDRFSMDGFNHQNPIVGLEIIWEYVERLQQNLFAVDWGGTGIHHEASFTCAAIEVVEVADMQAEPDAQC